MRSQLYVEIWPFAGPKAEGGVLSATVSTYWSSERPQLDSISREMPINILILHMIPTDLPREWNTLRAQHAQGKETFMHIVPLRT